MKIKAIQFADDGFMTQAFAFGGENKADGSPDVRYPSSLQNYLIDTGDEVILVDTGFRPDANMHRATRRHRFTSASPHSHTLKASRHSATNLNR